MATFQLYEDYTPPSWSKRPELQYYLEILKNGMPYGTKPVNQKAMYLIGKNSEICDIVLDNPTISRKHAVLQSKNTDELFIYDLGSTHGTFVNHHKIQSKLFHKLKVFDQLQFGQSQRVYILRCDQLEQEDSKLQEEQVQQRLEKKKARKEFKSLKEHYLNLLYQNPQFKFMKPKKQQEELDGIDWGIQDEYEVYRYQQEQEYPLEPDILMQLPGLSEFQIKKIEKYGEKLSTYRAQQGELDELVSKERKNYGLAETQEKIKSDLEQKVQELGGELENLEVGLKYHIFGEKTSKKNQDNYGQQESSEDEYYDNTIQKKVKPNENIIQEPEKPLEQTTETYYQLKNKLEELMRERNLINEQLINLKKNEEKEIDEEDDLDKFMKQTAQTMASEERPKLLQLFQQIKENIDKVTAQLKYVKPDFAIGKSFFEEQEPTQTAEVEEQFIQTLPPMNSIDQKLEELKRIKEKEQQEEEEENEEIILQKAQQYFEKEGERERKIEEQRLKYLKQQEKVKEIILEHEKQEAQISSQKQQAMPTPKPVHSRNYREKEFGSQDYEDITKYM